MRERVIRELGELAHPRFLVYLMGPYAAFDIGSLLESNQGIDSAIDHRNISDVIDFGRLVGRGELEEWRAYVADLLDEHYQKYKLRPMLEELLEEFSETG